MPNYNANRRIGNAEPTYPTRKHEPIIVKLSKSELQRDEKDKQKALLETYNQMK